MKKQRVLAVGLMVCVTFTLTAAAQKQTEPEKPAGPIAEIAAELVAELEATWPRIHDWPRAQSDYAATGKVKPTEAQIIAALGERLHRDPAVDGYVKWQLLSFNPDIQNADVDAIRKVLAALPVILPQPETTENAGEAQGEPATFALRGQRRAVVPRLAPVNAARGLYRVDPKVSVLTTGASLSVGMSVDPRDPRYVTATVEAGNSQLIELRRIVERVNVPTLAFRAALIQRVPQPGGLRLAARYADMADRIHAGDPSYQQAVACFVSECETSADDATITVALRQRLVEALTDLYRFRTDVTRSITTVKSNQFQVDKEQVRLSNEDYKAAREALLGRRRGS